MLSGNLSSVTFRSGLKVDLSNNSILVIIGPNNSGKSATLSDISSLLSEENAKTVSLGDLELKRISSVDEIKQTYEFALTSTGQYDFKNFQFSDYGLTSGWGGTKRYIGKALANLLVSNLSTRARLEDCDPAPFFDIKKPHYADHPFQRMYLDDNLEKDISRVFRSAFKRDLIVHRASSSTIPLYVGDRPIMLAGEDRVSRSYLDRLEYLDHLEKQGDGVRSFVSIISRVMTEKKSIQLIDEPEAFLHPPQARMLGHIIGERSSDYQTVIATHSQEILQGLLAGGHGRVSVVRVTRGPDAPSARYLTNTNVESLWSDPLLRFSNILNGLFHEGVIITEADADCRFYETIASLITDRQDLPDIHYTYSGGKDRIALIVQALRAVGVPTVSIVDFDVLNNEQPLRKIIEAHGASWSAMESDWRVVRDAVENKASFLSGDRFREDVGKQLKLIEAGTAVPMAIIGEIRRLAKRASPWDNVKTAGLAALPSGGPTKAANKLLNNLRAAGIFVCPDGEMESFCRSVGGHGPRWVEEVLEKDVANDGELVRVREFVANIIAYLTLAMPTGEPTGFPGRPAA